MRLWTIALTYDDRVRNCVSPSVAPVRETVVTPDDVGNRTQRVDRQGTRQARAHDDMYRLPSGSYPGPSGTDGTVM